MANTDTISALFGPGTGRFQINALTLAVTTETVFLASTDTGTTPAVLSLPVGGGTNLVGSGSPVDFNQNAAISSQSYGRKVAIGTEMPYFSAKTFDSGRPFRIHVAGTCTLNTGTCKYHRYQSVSGNFGYHGKRR